VTGCSCHGITANPRFPPPNGKAAKATNLDPVTHSQGFGHEIDQVFHRHVHGLGRQMGLALLQERDEFRAVHYR